MSSGSEAATASPATNTTTTASVDQPSLDDALLESVAQADPGWQSCARQRILHAAATARPFQAYDIADDLPEPITPAQWGAAFRAAAKDGVIRRVGYEPGRRPTVNGSAVAVWIGVR